MSKPSAFDKEHITAATAEKRGGILEELHLPPQVIAFIRNNSKKIGMAAGGCILVIFGWIFYDYYVGAQNEKAAASLAAVLQEKDETSRQQGLEKVVSEYSRTSAALWSKLELGHLEYQAGNYDKALKKYNDVLDSLSRNNPLVPLITYGIAQALEQKKDIENALQKYQALSQMPGFEEQGYLGMGRLYEADNRLDKAKEVYEEYLSLLNVGDSSAQPSRMKIFVENELARLNPGQGGEKTQGLD